MGIGRARGGRSAGLKACPARGNASGRELEPAPHGFSDGDRVAVDGEPDPGGVSLQMAGPILRVRSVKKA